ncbi:MAG TPA: thiamine pyrophosphate-dependent enzyme [Prolixibacteraceae bacterium]|nr:thiamine pyrophosphate-dependent enzyme [Prolixibacteraceae bacterium]
MAELQLTDIIKPENKVYGKSKIMTDTPLHYCYGCSHGVVHKLIADVIEEMNIQEDTIGVAPVGCSVMMYYYLDIDWLQAPHGRAPAVATGYKRTNPSKYVFTYQGDGDLAAIGTAETMHAVNRGENIVIIFINNAIYGMTGGQMAPTSLVGQETSTCPFGRDVDINGYPMKITELVAQLPGAAFVTRQSVHTPGNVRKCKKAIRKAFENSAKNIGTSFVEVVSTCNSGWKIDPVASNKRMEENMFPFYPLGDIKDGQRDDVDNYSVQKLKK